MTTASLPRSSRETWTIRPDIFPFSSNTLNALNMSLIHLRLHLEPCVPRFLDGSFVLNRRDVAGVTAAMSVLLAAGTWSAAACSLRRRFCVRARRDFLQLEPRRTAGVPLLRHVGV